MQIEKLYQIYLNHPEVQTDTRKLAAGQIFFALKGPNFNGNFFAEKALELGAAAVVIDEDVLKESEKVFRVEDGLNALQALALHHRKQFNIPFLAITGSNGKTTTKELIHAVLSSSYKTYTTQGNLNNHIGIPLTILSIKKDAEMAVIEMGANHQKEIEGYCKVALPTHGLINNCGKAHMEGFGGVEGIRKGKGELFDFLAASNGTAFVNSDLDYLLPMSEKISHKIFYGSTLGHFKTTITAYEPFLSLLMKDENENLIVNTQLVGTYNQPNVEAAICVGEHFNISHERMVQAISQYSPDNARSQMIVKGNNRIILDAYNANPSSMQAAIDNFEKQHANKKMLCLGAMMELGETSVMEHQFIIDILIEKGLNNVVLVGGDFENVNHPFKYFHDSVESMEWLKEQHLADALVLIKGSRSTKMEKLMDAF